MGFIPELAGEPNHVTSLWRMSVRRRQPIWRRGEMMFNDACGTDYESSVIHRSATALLLRVLFLLLFIDIYLHDRKQKEKERKNHEAQRSRADAEARAKRRTTFASPRLYSQASPGRYVRMGMSSSHRRRYGA